MKKSALSDERNAHVESAEDAIFNDVDTVETETIETETLVPVNAVTSNGREKETELSTSPLLLSHDKLAHMETMLANLDHMSTGVCLNAKYKEFDAVGETMRGIYVGKKTMYKGKGLERKEFPAVQWIDAKKQLWVNAGTILVNQLENVPEGTPIEIIYTEKLRMDVGIAKNYEVRALYE